MVRDLSDPYEARRRQAQDVRRLQASTAIQNTAVDRGALRVKSAEGLEVGTAEDPTGSEVVYGVLRIVGQLIGAGVLTWNGGWVLAGDGDITGDVDLTGNLTVLAGGQIKVGNVLITPGAGGKITVGTGSAQVVIDGATGKITAGDLTIDPTEGGGAVVFDNGAQLYSADQGNQIELVSGDAHVTVKEYQIELGLGSRGIIVADEGASLDPGIYVTGVPLGTPTSYLGVDADNRLVRPPSGGPSGPGTPGEPGDNPAGYIYPVNPDAWHLGDDFAAHIARGSAEPGIDWWTSVGTPVWAPGDGTIVATSSSNASAMGRYVTLVTDAGDWFRFLHNSAIAVTVGQTVTQGQVLAYTGGSGNGSDAGYGPHTHVSFKQGYTGIFPGGAALDDFYAYMLAA